MKLLTPEKDGQVVLDLEDVVQRGMTVVREGENLWPPPPVSVSAAPTKQMPAVKEKAPVVEKQPMTQQRRFTLIGIGVLALFLVNAYAPDPLPQHFTVLVLAVIIGYYVIGNVHHALHTPLMSVTNAISGIIVVGAVLQVVGDDPATRIRSFVAILLASINIFGGFAVTRRMLSMFSKG
jgi:NAD(P) transhydrogenase subunit alpha